MCTAIIDIPAAAAPDTPVLLAGIRDELVDRPWQPPGWHWPTYPGLAGGLDLEAGGTWLAVAPGDQRVTCVLNGRGRAAPSASRRSRGVLPLLAAAGEPLPSAGLDSFDPFHLLTAEPGRASLRSWDGERFTERTLTAGLYMVVNSGLAGQLASGDGHESAADGKAVAGSEDARAADEADRERARVAHFLPRLRAAPRPAPRPGLPVAQAWGEWLPLMNGAGIPPDDPRALLVLGDLGGGRILGTTSVSLVALAPGMMRYDFTGIPGDPDAWQPIQADISSPAG